MTAGTRNDEEQWGGASGIGKFITFRDIEYLMKKHNHFDDLDREGDDIRLLISRFDKDGDGKISINEFYEQIEP